MMRICDGNYTWILISSKKYRIARQETAPDDMVIEAVQALFKFCGIVSQQNEYELSHIVVDHSLMWYVMTSFVVWEQKILYSVQARLDISFASEYS